MRAVNHFDEEAPDSMTLKSEVHHFSPRGATKALMLFTAKSFLHLVPLLTTKKRLCLISISTAWGCNASLSFINLSQRERESPVRKPGNQEM
jgi:hypothetical protein